MNKTSVFHRVDSEYSYCISEDTLVLRLRCAKNDLLESYAYTGNRCYPAPKVPVQEHKMTKVCTGMLYDYWEVTIKSPYHRVFYYFKITDGKETYYYYQDEFHAEPEEDRTYFYQLPYMRREEVYSVPEWAQKSVMYQIFPDSFATGIRTHKGRDSAIAAMKKNNTFPKPKEVVIDGNTYKSIYGGTLKGIIDNVPYLKELGVSLVYMNPIFAAISYHKYDTIDYKSIDPVFGTNEDFRELVKTFHENGIRIILDGVFNHSGRGFFAFQDIIKNQEKSKYKDWFYRLEFPVKDDGSTDYACFAYVKEMPKLNTGNREVAEYFAEVGKYWIKEFDVDGWRLDVANEVDKNFWRTFRAAVRSVKKDALVLAEIWEDARNWLTYDQFDSAMNYRFTYLSKKFFADRSIGAREFGGNFSDYLMRYPTPISYAQMNLLDSHDVSRFLTQCGDNVDRYLMAIFVQMTIPGLPSIFAGDELGMAGLRECDYRMPLDWENAVPENKVYSEYRRLVNLRNTTPVLTEGRIRFIDTGNDSVLAYERFDDKTSMIFTVNNSDSDVSVKVKGETISLKANSYMYK